MVIENGESITFVLKRHSLYAVALMLKVYEVCQFVHLYCHEYYVLLMTPSISGKPPFVGLSPQFSFTGEGVEKVLALYFSLPWVQTADSTQHDAAPHISQWSGDSGLHSPPHCGENMYCRTQRSNDYNTLIKCICYLIITDNNNNLSFLWPWMIFGFDSEL